MASEGLAEGDSNSSTVPSRTTPNGVLTRIRRTLSTKSYFTSKPPKTSRSPSQPGTPSVYDDPSSPSSQVTYGEPISGIATPKGSNLTPFEKFVKTLKRKRDGKSSTSEFPPSHWEIIEEQQEVSEEPKDLPEVSPLDDTPAEPDVLQVSEENTPPEGPRTPTEPATVAQRIQTMLSSFPPFFVASLPAPTSGEPSSSASSTSSATQRVPMPLFITDSKLVSLLSSASIMNGSADKARPSVWTILDHLKAKLPGQTPPGESSNKGKQTDIGASQSGSRDDDNSSVMLYAPLVPDDASEIEVARSEVLPEPEPTDGTKKGEKSGDGDSQTEQSTRKRVWVPSSTKLSLQLNWWGYRLYLPPPVLAILDNKRLESTKRAAIITTALKWALDHIPTVMIPPQMRPVLTILKSLVPYLGYIGGFVAWSWGAIKTFDKGNGVVLTATWLLPVALIPGTWEDDDYPEVVEQLRGVADVSAPPSSSRN